MHSATDTSFLLELEIIIPYVSSDYDYNRRGTQNFSSQPFWGLFLRNRILELCTLFAKEGISSIPLTFGL